MINTGYENCDFQIEHLEEYELDEPASGEDLAIADTILADLLLRTWLASQKPKASLKKNMNMPKVSA